MHLMHHVLLQTGGNAGLTEESISQTLEPQNGTGVFSCCKLVLLQETMPLAGLFHAGKQEWHLAKAIGVTIYPARIGTGEQPAGIWLC